MNKLLLGLSSIISAIAIAISGLTAYQLSQLQGLIEAQQKNLNQQQNTITKLAKEVKENKSLSSAKSNREASIVDSNSSVRNISLQPGQFVRQGVDNKIKIELLSVNRIQNPDSQNQDVVVVKMRIRRLVPKGKVDAISINQSKARNPETSEVYSTIVNRSTKFTYINDLPQDSWGNAYFWLKVPENVDTIDIIIPETAIFDRVPISS